MSECYFCDPPRYATHAMTVGRFRVKVCKPCADEALDESDTIELERIPDDEPEES